MDTDALNEKMIALRAAELESRKKMVTHIREIHRRKLWQKLGFRSLREFCRKYLKYDDFETREVLIACGVIFTQKQMVDSDPKVQKRIDRLLEWRRGKAGKQNVPNYLIFSNQVLMAIAKSNPESLDELEQTPGIGIERLDRYGKEILRRLANDG